MPRKPKATPAEFPAIPAELLEQFGNCPMTAEAISTATLALKKALIKLALGGEMKHHLCYSSGAAMPPEVSNQRNGKNAKTVLTEDGPTRIEEPHDRDGSFQPLLIPKHKRRFTGFDDKIVAIYDAKLVPVGHTRHDRARNPGFSARAVRHRGVAGFHQFRHR